MKYLFLDIDGVLNHEDWYKNKVQGFRHLFKSWEDSCFDPDCVRNLLEILNETGAKLVVSSSWRFDRDLKKYFEKLGIPTDFDITPSLTREDENGALTWPDRGDEIAEFLKGHPCDEYVILDDDMDFSEDQIENHFVHCCADFTQAFKEGHEGETGLTRLKMQEAINILNKPNK